MFKLVVLSALFAIAAAKPSGFEYSAPALSHQYRTGVISEPVVSTYTAPIVQKAVVAAPIVKKVVATPIYRKVVATPIVKEVVAPAPAVISAPASYSAYEINQSQVEVRQPIVSLAYSAPVSYEYAAHAPVSWAPYEAVEHSW